MSRVHTPQAGDRCMWCFVFPCVLGFPPPPPPGAGQVWRISLRRWFHRPPPIAGGEQGFCTWSGPRTALPGGCHCPPPRPYHIPITPLSQPYHIPITPLSHPYHIPITPVSCPYHAPITLLSHPASSPWTPRRLATRMPWGARPHTPPTCLHPSPPHPTAAGRCCLTTRSGGSWRC